MFTKRLDRFRSWTLLFFLLLSVTSFAQKNNESYQLKLKRLSGDLRVDGLVEEVWNEADVAKDFFSVLPMDTSYAKVRTEVRMAYDDHNLYLIAVCYKVLPGPN